MEIWKQASLLKLGTSPINMLMTLIEGYFGESSWNEAKMKVYIASFVWFKLSDTITNDKAFLYSLINAWVVTIVTCLYVQCLERNSSCYTKTAFSEKLTWRTTAEPLLLAINFAKWTACIILMYLWIGKPFSWALKSLNRTCTVAVIDIFSAFFSKVCHCWYLARWRPKSFK